MVSSWEQGKLLHRAINACLCPLYAVEGMHVVTVEGAYSESLLADWASKALLSLYRSGADILANM